MAAHDYNDELMLKRFAAAAVFAPMLAMAPLAYGADPGIVQAIDGLPAKAAEMGYPIGFSVEFEFKTRDDAVATHLSFVNSGIRPPGFGLSQVREYEGVEPVDERRLRSVKWFFRSQPYRIDTPEQFAQELQKLRTLKFDGIVTFHTKLGAGANVPPPVPMPK